MSREKALEIGMECLRRRAGNYWLLGDALVEDGWTPNQIRANFFRIQSFLAELREHAIQEELEEESQQLPPHGRLANLAEAAYAIPAHQRTAVSPWTGYDVSLACRKGRWRGSLEQLLQAARELHPHQRVTRANVERAIKERAIPISTPKRKITTLKPPPADEPPPAPSTPPKTTLAEALRSVPPAEALKVVSQTLKSEPYREVMVTRPHLRADIEKTLDAPRKTYQAAQRAQREEARAAYEPVAQRAAESSPGRVVFMDKVMKKVTALSAALEDIYHYAEDSWPLVPNLQRESYLEAMTRLVEIAEKHRDLADVAVSKKSEDSIPDADFVRITDQFEKRMSGEMTETTS